MRSMVEGAAGQTPTPLRQRFALPPPRPGEDYPISFRNLRTSRTTSFDARGEIANAMW